MLLKSLCALLVFTMQASCGDHHPLKVRGDATGRFGSGIYGQITLGPQCPVQREREPCPDKPYVAVLIVLDTSGVEIARTSSGADGIYEVALDPGAYEIVPEGSPLVYPLPPPSVTIAVAEGEWVTLDLSYDTGIR